MQGPVKYDMLHAQHSKIMANIGLADDKARTALHIFRSTGNLMLEIEGADKDKVSSWGRWVQSTKEVLYDAKSSLHNLPVQMLLAGWGDDYKKEYFLGHSTVKLPSDVFDEFVNYLRPSLVVVEHKVAKMLKEIDALPHKEKQWQCNQKARTCLTDMQRSVQAERRLISVFLYGLPLLLDLYTTKRLVVVRGSIKVRKMLQDVRYKEYCILVRNAHKKALDRIELARLPLEQQMATQLEQLAMQQADAHSHAVKAMLANLKVTQNPMTSAAVVVDEPESRDQQASFASLTESPVVAANCGLLHFADLDTV